MDLVENDDVLPGIDIDISVKPQFIDDALRLKVFFEYLRNPFIFFKIKIMTIPEFLLPEFLERKRLANLPRTT